MNDSTQSVSFLTESDYEVTASLHKSERNFYWALPSEKEMLI